MKLIYTVLIFALVPAFAQSDKIKASQKLEKEFSALKYESAKDRDKGAEMVPQVIKQLRGFIKSKPQSKAREEEFRALVTLVGAALPYDGEVETAGMIHVLIDSAKELRRVYDDSLKLVKDACNERLLRSTIEERQCEGSRGDTEQAQKECMSKFNYEACKGVPELRE